MQDYPQLNQAIARILTTLRTQKNLSKKRLAEIAGLERVYIIQLEKGEKRPTVNALFLLSRAFGMKASRLIQLVEKEITELKKEVENG